MKRKITIAAMCMVVLVPLASCMRQTPPVITAVTAFYHDELTVEFHAHADPSLMFVWDTGDGGRTVGKDPIYEYAKYGEYVVTVTATNNSGQSSEFTTLVNVARWQVCYYEGAHPKFPWACTYPIGALRVTAELSAEAE